jgi:hypothetical protein
MPQPWTKLIDVQHPRLLQRPRVEKLKRRSGPLNSSPSQLPFGEQIEQERSNVLRAQLIGCLMKVAGELSYGMRVVTNRAFGEVAQPEIFLDCAGVGESWIRPFRCPTIYPPATNA